jgi:low affinity Fe/Cu permease
MRRRGFGVDAHGHLRGFSRFTRIMARASGRAVTFACAAGLIVIWAIAGPFLGFSTVWQLTINTATTIVTFLMVFIIQNTQNRDTEAMQIKLDELLRANTKASNVMLDLEDMPQGDLTRLQRHYADMAEDARAKVHRLEELSRSRRPSRPAAGAMRKNKPGRRRPPAQASARRQQAHGDPRAAPASNERPR